MSCSNQVVRFALSDSASTAPYGITVTDKLEAGAQGLLVRGSTKVHGICCDSSGNLYMSDYDRHTIIKVDEGGRISNFAGTEGVSGTDLANWTAGVRSACNSALFDSPMGVCCDKSGNIYVADNNNHCIRKISGGYVSTVAGEPGTSGRADGIGPAAKFSYPIGIAIDNAGILYVADWGNNMVRKIFPNGLVQTLAGNVATGAAGDVENVEANGQTASFNGPWNVTVDPQGNVYVLDTNNHKIKKITPNGWIYLHSGSGAAGHSLGTAGTTAATCQQFTCTYGVLLSASVDKSGNMYVIDRQEGYTRLLRLTYTGVPAEVVAFNGSAYNDCPIAVTVNPSQKLFVTMSFYEMGVSSSSTSSASSSSSSSG